MEVIQSGLLLKFKVDLKNEGLIPDYERHHEIYMCIEKRLLDTGYEYNFYFYDINANDSYVEIPSLGHSTNVFIQEYIKKIIWDQTNIALNVFTYNIRQLIPTFYPTVSFDDLHEPKLISMGANGTPYNLFDSIGYMCTTAARRIAIFCACSVEIKDARIFDERLSQNYLFYQNYINYLTQTYRMAIWIMENPILWYHTTDQRVLTRIAQMEDKYIIDKTIHWPVLLMADSFQIKSYDFITYYQKGSLHDLVVQLESSKSYIKIIQFVPGLSPGSKVQKVHKYWYQHGSSDQAAFVDEKYEGVQPTCHQMSQFCSFNHQFR